MKRNIIFSLIAIVLMAASCTYEVKVGDTVIVPFEQSDLDPNETIVYTLNSVLQIDPINASGIDLLKHMDIFDGYTFSIYRENAKVVAVEITENIPFEVYAQPFEGKVAAYFDTERLPWTIRNKETDQVIATYLKGELYVGFQLGCQEVSYELRFK